MWFFLKDEEFVSKTINYSNIDLNKFSASKVSQLAKKMESSTVTARHFKHVASDSQTAQSNLLQHQHTDLLASQHKKSFVKPRPPSHKNDASDRQPVPSYHNINKRSFDAKEVYKNKERCQKCGYSLHAEGFQCPSKNISANLVTSMDILQAYVIKRNKFLSSLGNQRSICCKW